MTTPAVIATRHYVIDCPSVPGDGSFNFQNLLQGRVDNACRAVTSAVFLSHGMRQDTAISLVLAHPTCGTVTVTWLASALVGVWPDEKSIATRLQRALCHFFGTPCPQAGDKRGAPVIPLEGVKGVSCFPDGGGFVGAVERAAVGCGASPVVVLLDEGGATRDALDASAARWAAGRRSGFVFAIGGPDGLSEATAAAVVALPRARTVRLPGPSLHAGAVITLTHNILDAALEATGVAIDTTPKGALAVQTKRNREEGPNAREGGRGSGRGYGSRHDMEAWKHNKNNN